MGAIYKYPIYIDYIGIVLIKILEEMNLQQKINKNKVKINLYHYKVSPHA